MISHQQDVYKWQFTFLGADVAFDAAGMGIDQQGVARYDKQSARPTGAPARGGPHAPAMRTGRRIVTPTPTRADEMG